MDVPQNNPADHTGNGLFQQKKMTIMTIGKREFA
jgi:hypothetical protein